jgi:hypothetical protein
LRSPALQRSRDDLVRVVRGVLVRLVDDVVRVALERDDVLLGRCTRCRTALGATTLHGLTFIAPRRDGLRCPAAGADAGEHTEAAPLSLVLDLIFGTMGQHILSRPPIDVNLAPEITEAIGRMLSR